MHFHVAFGRQEPVTPNMTFIRRSRKDFVKLRGWLTSTSAIAVGSVTM